jgi:hypothetical protein
MIAAGSWAREKVDYGFRNVTHNVGRILDNPNCYRPTDSWYCRVHIRPVSYLVPSVDDQLELGFCVLRWDAKSAAYLLPDLLLRDISKGVGKLVRILKAEPAVLVPNSVGVLLPAATSSMPFRVTSCTKWSNALTASTIPARNTSVVSITEVICAWRAVAKPQRSRARPRFTLN